MPPPYRTQETTMSTLHSLTCGVCGSVFVASTIKTLEMRQRLHDKLKHSGVVLSTNKHIVFKGVKTGQDDGKAIMAQLRIKPDMSGFAAPPKGLIISESKRQARRNYAIGVPSLANVTPLVLTKDSI